MAGDGAPEIARLVPRLRRLFPDIGPALTSHPNRNAATCSTAPPRCSPARAGPFPPSSILEDLHWADEATLLLLDHLARHLVAVPVLIVGTYRDVELDIRPALARTLDGLIRERLVRQLPLARLPESALAEMLGALAGHEAPDAVVDLVFKETEGNPFFVEEVFRHLAEEGRLLDADGRFRPDAAIGEFDVPENVRLVVGRRLDRLPDDARRVLGVAAVIGRTFRYELLETAAGPDGDTVLDAIDDAERARLRDRRPRPGRRGVRLRPRARPPDAPDPPLRPSPATAASRRGRSDGTDARAAPPKTTPPTSPTTSWRPAPPPTPRRHDALARPGRTPGHGRLRLRGRPARLRAGPRSRSGRSGRASRPAGRPGPSPAQRGALG